MFGYHSCGITAGKYWVALEESYLTNVQLKAMELRKQLQNLNKDRLTIAQYMLKAKTIVGNLSIIGDSISKKDLLLYMLKNLRPRYNICFNIQMREVLPSINTVHSYLEGYEKML